jgi:hypothetical protein
MFSVWDSIVDLGNKSTLKITRSTFMTSVKNKKIILFVYCLFEAVLLFSLTKREPAWFRDYKTMYRSSEYIAQIGMASSEEHAITDAITQIARYFNTQVDSTLTTHMQKTVNDDEVIFDLKNMINDSKIKSQENLFALEYTEVYYSKSEKMYYCLAYINRDYAWSVYQPQIEMAKELFYSFYNKAQSSTESFSKFFFFNQSQKASKDFIEKLNYARLLHPKKEALYKADRDVIASIPLAIKEQAGDATIALSINDDYGKTLETAIKKVFSNEGFILGKNGKYKLSVIVEPNIEGENPLAISPSVSLELTNIDGRVFYSYAYQYEEKTIAYGLDTAKKRVYPKIAEILTNNISTDLQKNFEY